MKKNVLKAVNVLKELYPTAICSLNYEDPFQLLVATRLSAQCTDARVNLITPNLFKALPNAKSFKDADITVIENLIHSCGLYKTKAKDLKAMSTMLVDKYDSKIPNTLNELTSLPGIGRKTANLIMGDVFKQPAVVTDTHFIRICNRLGFVNTKNPLKVEKTMRELLDDEESNDFCHRTVLFGRDICTARSPKCEKCPLKNICKYVKKP